MSSLSSMDTAQTVVLRQSVRLRVAYTPGTAPALVFLHGGLGNCLNWRSQYEFAQHQGWEALAFDLAGHGASAGDRRYSVGRYRRDLTRLLHHFHIHAPILCCHSYGVPIGLEWAQRHAIRGLIVIAGGTHNLTPWWEVPALKLLKWSGRHWWHHPQVQQLREWFTRSPQSPPLAQYWQDCPLPRHLPPYQAFESFWGYNFLTHRKTDRLSQVPLLIITGGRDPMFPYHLGAEVAAQFPHSQHLHFPSASHAVMAELPEQVNAAIATFVHTHASHAVPQL